MEGEGPKISITKEGLGAENEEQPRRKFHIRTAKRITDDFLVVTCT